MIGTDRVVVQEHKTIGSEPVRVTKFKEELAHPIHQAMQ